MAILIHKYWIWGLGGIMLLAGVMLWWKSRRIKAYPYMDQPIEAINYWLGYYEDTTYQEEGLLGTIPLSDSVFVLDTYKEMESSRLQLIEDMAHIQLTFAFRHAAPHVESNTQPWRIANQGGILLGNEIPIRIIETKDKQPIMLGKAISSRTHNFEFHWEGYKGLAQLPSGQYELIIEVAKADIPQSKRSLVKNIFSPSYYPEYRLHIEIP